MYCKVHSVMKQTSALTWLVLLGVLLMPELPFVQAQEEKPADDAKPAARSPKADQGQTMDELVNILQEVVKGGIPADTPAKDKADLRLIQTRISTVRSYLSRGDYTNARRYVSPWTRQINNPDLKKICESLLEKIDGQMDEHVSAIMTTAEELIEDARKACIEATEPSDLDSIGDRLYEFRNYEMNQNNNARSIQRLRRDVEQTAQFIDRWQNYLEAKSARNEHIALQALNSLTNSGYNYGSGHSFKLVPTQHINTIKIELQNKYQVQIEDELEKLNEAITLDTSIEDVETLQAQVSELYQRIQSTNIYHLQQRLNRAQNTVRNWANLLYAESSGDYHAALRQLQSITGDYNRDYKMIDAKIIIAKRQQLMAHTTGGGDELTNHVEQIVQKINDAQSANDALIEINILLGNNHDPHAQQSFYPLRKDLNDLISMYRAVEQGRHDLIWETPTTDLQYHPWVIITSQLREQILRQAIAQALKLEKFEAAEEGETPAAGLLRLADAAAQKQDWQQVLAILDTYALAFTGTQKPAWLQAEIQGCQAFLAASQLEKFGQTQQAIESYTITLKQIGKRIPHEQAAKRLEALQ